MPCLVYVIWHTWDCFVVIIVHRTCRCYIELFRIDQVKKLLKASKMARPRRVWGKGSRTVPSLDVVLNILAGRVRREILLSLARGKKDVTTLARAQRRNIAMISGNLRPLREHRLVMIEQDAKRRIYQLAPIVCVRKRGPSVKLSIVTRDGYEVSISTVTQKSHGY